MKTSDRAFVTFHAFNESGLTKKLIITISMDKVLLVGSLEQLGNIPKIDATILTATNKDSIVGLGIK